MSAAFVAGISLVSMLQATGSDFLSQPDITGLMQSEKTSVMSTHKCLGAHFWQINPLVETSSGQEWQFNISIVKVHRGRSAGRSTPLVKTSSGQEWQF